MWDPEGRTVKVKPAKMPVASVLRAEQAAVAAVLVLDDGTTFEGSSFGAQRSVAGEVVFNTGMVGYPETLTDPSYSGQILVCTYPLIGNYGVTADGTVDGMCTDFESERIQVEGLIVADYSNCYSHWSAARSLSQWLNDHHVPALTGIDTRALTKNLREKGPMLGALRCEGCALELRAPTGGASACGWPCVGPIRWSARTLPAAA